MNLSEYLTPDENTQSTLEEAFERTQKEATGEITYGFTNDFMFKAVFQKNPRALKDLLCAVFQLKPEDILSCVITNPFVLGESVTSKTCILDIRICLNNNQKIDLEMQMGNLGNWQKRSVYYLCSMFVDLKKGQDYHQALPCVHVGFVNESPFPDYHEFVSRYVLTNPENGHIYSEDIALITVDLSQADEQAPYTEEKIKEEHEPEKDRLYQWAKLFKAHDWKEVMDLAKTSDGMKEAVVTLHELSEEEKIRLECLGRIMYNGDMSSAEEKGWKRGRQEGMLKGRMEGRQEGMQQGAANERERINRLNQMLISRQRFDDLQKASADTEYQNQLMREYGILPEKTET